VGARAWRGVGARVWGDGARTAHPRWAGMGIVIGTAGWSIGATEASAFPEAGSALERYAARFAGVEINSSFHRPHRASTWARWGASVPAGFRFSVKVPKTITHKAKLADCADLVETFLDEAGALGDRLAILLVQLPPSLAFDAGVAERFFAMIGGASEAAIACEPRHASWFEGEADATLARLMVARVAADPAKVPAAAIPGGWRGLSYFRLHGSPTIYRSSYDDARLDAYAGQLREAARLGPAWCMFDNTAGSAATGNALALQDKTGLHG
jgi:uncharacterized protein YecE (DUF72 family)